MHKDLEALVDQANRSMLGATCQHLRIGEVRYYLRIGRRTVNGNLVKCLQIGTVDVEPRHQRKGHFTRSLEELKKVGLPIYVENVINEAFGDALERRGYPIVRRDNYCRDFLIQ